MSVPDWLLERHRLGELPALDAGAVRDAVARDAQVRERLAALERSTEDILQRHPPRAMAASIRARVATSAQGHAVRPRSGPRPILALTLAAAAVAGVAVLAPRGTVPPETVDVTRAKGGAAGLVVYRSAAGGPERLQPGSVARHHDVVQLAYQVAANRHGAIVSVDGAGVVTRHLPATGTSSVPLDAGAAVPLPEAYELDASPGYERFVLVTSDRPFPVEVVVAAVRAAAAGGPDGRLHLPPGMEPSSFVLRKESAR